MGIQVSMSSVANVKATDWIDRARSTFDLYRDELLRQVASKLIRPRSQYTADELRERMVAALDDPVGIDRTLKAISPAGRQLLRLIDMSRQMRWQLSSLADLLPVLGFTDGIGPVQELLEAGLLFPELPAELPIESISVWLQQATFDPISVFAVPSVAARCRSEAVDLQSPVGDKSKLTAIGTDGQEWLLRLAVIWQLVRAGSLRRTQNGGLFKRDQDRLRAISLLTAAPNDAVSPPEDPALLVVELARGLGIVREDAEEWLADELPARWNNGLDAALTDIWSVLNGVRTWDPVRGYDPDLMTRKWLPTLSIALIAALNEASASNWHDPASLAEWLAQRQPDAAREVPELLAWCNSLLFGLWHSLRLIDVAKTDDGWRVRLSAFSRDMIEHESPAAPATSVHQTLLVQPNLEVIVYRQGLTPSLIAKLSLFAEWKSLGLACTLTLTPESVYCGLESGMPLSDIQRTLERHASRPLSDSVIETLRSWATKRERVQVFPAAFLLEFRNPADLQSALKEGLVEHQLTERIGVVANEASLDYSRLRLLGSRDYLSFEERCVESESDGLTLLISEGKADLLLAAELRRFADPVEIGVEDRSRYRLSIASLQRARQSGIDLRWLEDWFQRRSGFGVPPTAKLLFQGEASGTMSIEPTTILRVPTAEIGDGLERWPATRHLMVERIGPTAFVVNSDAIEEMRQLLVNAGLNCS